MSDRRIPRRWLLVTAVAAWTCAMVPAVHAEAGATVSCPAQSAGRRADTSGVGTLFRGDPARLESLAPDRTQSGSGGTFTNTWSLPAGGGYVLACHYAGGSALVLPLGPRAQACRQTRTAFTCQAR